MSKERASIDEIYNIVSSELTKVEDKEIHIRESIIPRMDERRGREKSMRTEEVSAKLFRNPNKPAEDFELAEEVKRAHTGVTPELALEIADEVYYRLQPNADPEGSAKLDVFLDGLLGISQDHAYSFCIIKYETRLLFGDNPDYKEIEEEVMIQHLSQIPELKNIWPSEYITYS
ncbi:hypothetical protein IID21_01455 [Patescibacteria group bacterium]|nr:hypothetical protein [Patescibacteria group bacterium]